MVPVSFGRTVTGGVLPLGVITSCDQPIWDNLPLVATECDGSSRPSKQTGAPQRHRSGRADCGASGIATPPTANAMALRRSFPVYLWLQTPLRREMRCRGTSRGVSNSDDLEPRHFDVILVLGYDRYP
jgi:hypothetical protein